MGNPLTPYLIRAGLLMVLSLEFALILPVIHNLLLGISLALTLIGVTTVNIVQSYRVYRRMMDELERRN